MKSKPINVKIPTAKVIKALQGALDARKKQLADSEKGEKDYQKAQEDFLKAVTEAVLAGKSKVLETDIHHRYYGTREPYLQVSYSIPKGMKQPKEEDFVPLKGWGRQNIETEISELENAIKLLSMTDDEFVSTNTYNGVARYI